MSEGGDHGNASGPPIRKTCKIPIPSKNQTSRIQSKCSKNLENLNPFLRSQVGLPRNRLGNKIKKTGATDLRQSKIVSKSWLNLHRKEIEVSKSTPDLSRSIRSKIISVPTVAENLQKIKSLENMIKSGNASGNLSQRVQPPSRIPMKSISGSKSKPPNVLLNKSKKLDAEKKIVKTSKPLESKRKFGFMNGFSEGTKPKTTDPKLISPLIDIPNSLSVSNRTEECKKIIKKIMLEKRTAIDHAERGTLGPEFEDSISTFNSDEMAEMLSLDYQPKTVDASKGFCEVDKSSKRNSSEFDDSIGSFFSDQMVLTMSKSNEFLNLAESKHNFFNDSPLGLSVSDAVKNNSSPPSNIHNSMERTPSAEELPMECEVESSNLFPEPETIICDLSTSPTEELPQESLSSRTPNAPVSIITSITSIMSLDTGYQGDGELSRPESRNTENDSKLLKMSIVENGIPVKSINFDDGKTMTDSDFFTESDADIHDDLSAAAAEIGSGKGDRKAQVIDGTLYGGVHIQSHTVGGGLGSGSNDHNATALNVPCGRIIAVTNNVCEDMESSGIYSDFEKKPEELWTEKKNEILCKNLISEQIEMIQNCTLTLPEKKLKQSISTAEGLIKSSSDESSSTIRENPLSELSCPTVNKSPNEKTSSKENEQIPKKDKILAKGISSEMKSNKLNLVAGKEPQTKVKPVKKGKWDAVMDKIARGKQENKYTPSKFRDVKSKVFLDLGPLFNSRRNEAETPKTSSKILPPPQLKPRSRRNPRVRSSESSLVSPKSKQSRTTVSPNSSQRSSLSDISLWVNSHQKSTYRGSKKRDSISPQSNESTNSTNTPTRKINNHDAALSKTSKKNNPCKDFDLQNGNAHGIPSSTVLHTMKTPTLRKMPTPRRGETIGPSLHKTPGVPFKESNHNGILSKSGSAMIINNNTNSQNNNNNNNNNSNNNHNNNNNVKTIQNKSLKPGTRTSIQMKNGCLLAATKEANKALLKQLKHNGRAFESLAILFNYCANELDAFSTRHVKQKLENEKNKVVQAQLDIEELQAKLIRVREELNDKEVIITELTNDKLTLEEESEYFRKLVEELRNKLDVVTEQKCEAESELLKECENLRCLRREFSDRTDRFENEKDDLVCCLTEAKKENGLLKSANREIKEEYDRCLLENQRLSELISKSQNEMARMEKQNRESEITKSKIKANGTLNRSPERLSATPVSREKSFKLLATPNIVNPKCLESEVESLRQVLALKTDEVTELRRQELSLRENADRVPKLLSTITMLEGKVEDLQSQLSSQTDTVRDLFKSNEHLENELKSANIQKTRLTHKNEELQYKLKQYAEAMKQLATQKNLLDRSIKIESPSPIKTNYKRSESCSDDSVKSQMKSVVEKSDSMSYMLEMTEDSSEIVTNIIRRAESLRSTTREQVSLKKRKPKASSLSSSETPTIKKNYSMEDDIRPDLMSTSNSGSYSYEFDRHVSSPKSNSLISISPKFSSPQKTVKLNANDFSTDSIDVANEDDCEIIEITKNFDIGQAEEVIVDKSGEMLTSTSSSGSSSESNESHFDIESDVFTNLEGQADEEEEEEVVEEEDEAKTKAPTENIEILGNESTVIETSPVGGNRKRSDLPSRYQVVESSKVENYSGQYGLKGRNRRKVEEESERNRNPQNFYLSGEENCFKVLKISGGESMTAFYGDEENEDIEKIKIYSK